MKRLILAALLFAAPAQAQEVFSVYAGANGIWRDTAGGDPADFELGGSGIASLSPHIDICGGAWFGTGNSYVRGTIGPRFTATDTENKNFSVGLGAFYQGSSEPAIVVEGWHAEASVGLTPWPAKWPRFVAVAQAAYRFSDPAEDASRTSVLVGGRFKLGGAQ